MGIDLDESCPVQGFVSVAPVSLVWKDKMGRYEVKLDQGLAVSLESQHSWTIPNGVWTHRRDHFRGELKGLQLVLRRSRQGLSSQAPFTTPLHISNVLA